MSTKRAIRSVEVEHCSQLTPRMRRLRLVGDDLASFPVEMVGGYIKLLFPTADPTRSALADGDAEVDLAKYLKRSYTVRAFDPRGPSIDVDFVIGEGKGPATRWASRVKPGERALVVGPGPVKMIDPSADWFLLIGDMTALPAIGVNVERLPPNARGTAVIEVPSVSDKQPLAAGPDFDIRWLVTPPGATSSLAATVRALPWLEGRASVWSACEFGEMRRLRAYLREERALGKDDLYLSSYWKRDATDEEHKRAKAAERA